MSFRRNHDRDLERALRAARPAPREVFLDSLVRRVSAISPSPAGRAVRARLAVAVVVGLTGLAAFAAFGGAGYAAGAAGAVVDTVRVLAATATSGNGGRKASTPSANTPAAHIAHGDIVPAPSTGCPGAKKKKKP